MGVREGVRKAAQASGSAFAPRLDVHRDTSGLRPPQAAHLGFC